MRNSIDVQETPYPGIYSNLHIVYPVAIPKHKLYHLNVINERTFGEKIGKIEESYFQGDKGLDIHGDLDLNTSRFSLSTCEVKGNLIR